MNARSQEARIISDLRAWLASNRDREALTLARIEVDALLAAAAERDALMAAACAMPDDATGETTLVETTLEDEGHHFDPPPPLSTLFATCTRCLGEIMTTVKENGEVSPFWAHGASLPRWSYHTPTPTPGFTVVEDRKA